MQWRQLVNEVLKVWMKDKMFTAIPGEVKKVNKFNETQTVDVKPLVNTVYEDSKILEHSTIPSVPVLFPSAANGLLSFPIEVGDTVLVVFSMRSIEEWLDGGGELVSPTDTRMFNPSDAIAIPGLYTKSSHLSPHATDTELRFNNLYLKFKANGDIVLENGTSALEILNNQLMRMSNGSETFTMNAAGVITLEDGTSTVTMDGAGNIELNNGTHTLTLKSNGDVEHSSGAKITAAGDIISAAGKSLDTHLHSGVTSGGANTGPPV